MIKIKKIHFNKCIFMAGETRLEHATDGFGDRNSTIELLPLNTFYFTLFTAYCQLNIGGFMKNKSLAVIGCGNMAQAIINGIISNGIDITITVSDPNANNLSVFKNTANVNVINDNSTAVSAADYVLVAVKPQICTEVLTKLDLKNKVIISIMAGVSLDKLKTLTKSNKIVRVMPNLNARVGCSFNAYSISGELSTDDLNFITTVLNSFGSTINIKESQMDSITGLSGSGPAYVFMTIKAFYDEAIYQGFCADDAKSIAIQTFLGSVLTVEKTNLDELNNLIDSVCSKGGTTIEGVTYLKDNDYENHVRNAIKKSINRSKEMSGIK